LQELPIGNTLHIMHVERNVLGSILKYLFGDKDTIEVLRVCKWSAHVVTVYPVCPWMWTKDYWVGSGTCCGGVGGRLITWGPLMTGQRSAFPKGNG
jgi:hypothetical protein